MIELETDECDGFLSFLERNERDLIASLPLPVFSIPAT